MVPAAVGRLLFGDELSGVALAVARVAGIALISLGVACWPGRLSRRANVYGMIAYSALATVYLVYLGVRGWAGPLLWPAAGVHAVLTFLLLRSTKTNSDHAG